MITARNLRKAQSVIRLGAKYGAVKLDEARQRLLCFGSICISSLKRVLEFLGLIIQDEVERIEANKLNQRLL